VIHIRGRSLPKKEWYDVLDIQMSPTRSASFVGGPAFYDRVKNSNAQGQSSHIPISLLSVVISFIQRKI
jgi:hypothetical protein